ncbi:MAG: 16S rRNA (cytosine(1402)-N(4))-methyltransferase RsmH [Clostridiales bacterium]|mgnify:FL=1|nr:16S rRNA (cytosine(1402)-N(4))-methyltransferase RsmH [Clostridiales bacterium]
MEFNHIPVLLDDCIKGLNIKKNGIYIDCTAGGGGHSSEIAKNITSGKLIAIDRDPDAIIAATDRLKEFNIAQVVNANFTQIEMVLDELGIDNADGYLFDLGVSSHQLDEAKRGFSYKHDAPLDMRMSKDGLSAAEVINTYDVSALAKIIFEYGEDRFARSIAAGIGKARERVPIKTTSQLADIIKASVPAKVRRSKNPCKQTFQAIRIEVNKELDAVSLGLDSAFKRLSSGGRICVITFHSLEDRLVKQRFASWCEGCTCPPDFPICICGNTPKAKLINRKPILPSHQEIEANSRSKSAKLRILQKL